MRFSSFHLFRGAIKSNVDYELENLKLLVSELNFVKQNRLL